MEPVYMNENRYSYLVGSWRPQAGRHYVAEDPVGAFEQHLQELFLDGQKHLQHEEFTLALQSFQEVMALILRTVAPTMPIDPNQIGWVRFPLDLELVDVMTTRTAEILRSITPVEYSFPRTVASERSLLPPAVEEALRPAIDSGFHVTSFHGAVHEHVIAALNATVDEDWSLAIQHYQGALEQTPETELAIRGGLLHDLAVLSERADNREAAQEFAQASVDTFAQAKLDRAQAQALATTAGIFARGGNAGRTAELIGQLDRIKSTTLLGDIASVVDFIPAHSERSMAGARLRHDAGRAPLGFAEIAAPIAERALSIDPSAPNLVGTEYVTVGRLQKSLTINGVASSATINLSDTTAVASTRAFLRTIAVTTDIGLLVNWLTRDQFVAYIPHMYFFVLPMSIGDCYAGMGNLDDARESYASVLPYPFINKNYEIVKVWTRLARTYVDLGDQAYRNAKDDAAGYAAATAFYENVVRTDRTLNPASPLYANAKLASIMARVMSFLGAADPTQVNDNPAIVGIVLEAHSRLAQIQAGLNFFGFGPDYAPPFGFEYLQNTARYFAQHASQTEQRYIQYKSQAENEEFRRKLLSQQAEVARQTVVLEARGVTEAHRGIDVATASFLYAGAQVQNATAAKTEFDNARWELLGLNDIEAWASASSVGQDEQVLLTVSGSGYYSADRKRRNVVLSELAHQRTRLSHDLEAGRLNRAISSARVYQQVALQQMQQAQARLAVAQQRVQIAMLQQRQAEESRDFLDMREFGARLWYELAQQARRLTQRYLDMATEIAFLMERAYNAETERDLHVIRYDYQSTASGNLMGADMMLADIDSFTFDHITTTKSKKNPIRTTISLADSHPIQFHRLQTTGSCTFETSFADFDRQQTGLYLAKIRNVEVLFVGLAGVQPIAGTLRNIGVSRFRASNGGEITRLYPADVMVLSQYQIRQDALAFRANPTELRLFENNGIETLWQLDLPLDANDLDYSAILDVQIVLYYDGFFAPSLETQIRAALPASGQASRAVSMKFSSPDELFYLKNQGEAELVFDAATFPRNHKELTRTTTTIKLTGRRQTIQNLKLRLTSDAVGGELLLTTNANGEVLDPALQTLRNKAVLDRWRLAIRASDNPQIAPGGVLDLSGLEDVMVFFEYAFNYR